MSKFHERGFSLIELLVTISIIAILSAIGLVIYSSAMQQGRDSKRQSDLRSIQSALEQYFTDQFFYPSDTGMSNLLTNGGAFTSSIGSSNTPPSPVKTYLYSVPKDPSGVDYSYTPSPDFCDNATVNKCKSYCLYAELENPPAPLPPAPTGCSYIGNYNFAVSLP